MREISEQVKLVAIAVVSMLFLSLLISDKAWSHDVFREQGTKTDRTIYTRELCKDKYGEDAYWDGGACVYATFYKDPHPNHEPRKAWFVASRGLFFVYNDESGRYGCLLYTSPSPRD